MKTLPAALISAKNQLGGEAPWLILLDIDLKDDPITPTILYVVNNTSDVTFDGQLYTATSFEVQPPRESSRGDIPTVQLAVSNVTRSLTQYLEALSGCVGAEVTMRIVQADNLAADYSELTMTFDVLATRVTAQAVTFSLGAPNPLRSRFPVESYIAMHCNWTFKGPECAYAGSDTTCTRTWDACQDKSNTGRFGGFPGLHGGIRIV